jgi:hypothetical protein
LRQLVAVGRTDLLALQKKWDEVAAHLKSVAADLPDAELGRVLSRTTARALQDDQREIVDDLCRFVLEQEGSKGSARRQAASQWLSSASRSGDALLLPARVAELRTYDFTAEDMFSWYRRYFYSVMETGNPEALSMLLGTGDEIAMAVTDDDQVTQMQRMSLDGAFQLEDYPRALAVLESSDLGHDENWRGMAINKVKAHLALKQGQTQEAVDRFREFMKYVEGWEEAEHDPTTGMAYTKDMTLGFNARRVADILAGMDGKEAEAESAYREATAHFATALEGVKQGSDQFEYIQGEVAKIPEGFRQAPGEPEPSEK